MASLKQNNKGFVILITVTIITILFAVTLELHRRVSSSVVSASTTKDLIALSYDISSCINIGMAILIKDKKESEIDSVQEDWADPIKIEEIISQFSFKADDISLTITDELGKIQINALVKFPGGRHFQHAQQIMWNRFLEFIILEDESLQDLEATEIINSIKDWIDSEEDDLITGLNGAESNYYQQLDPPYDCRNAQITDLDELIYIKGITKELFEHAGGNLGLSEYITVYGAEKIDNKFTFSGKININTAPVPVLAAMLPAGYEFLAPVIDEYRQEKMDDTYVHDLSASQWYKDVPGCQDIEIDSQLIRKESDIFKIQCQATLGNINKTRSVFVQREQASETGKWFCRVLAQYNLN